MDPNKSFKLHFGACVALIANRRGMNESEVEAELAKRFEREGFERFRSTVQQAKRGFVPPEPKIVVVIEYLADHQCSADEILKVIKSAEYPDPRPLLKKILLRRPDLLSRLPAVKPTNVPHDNLPAEADRFIGRIRELAEIKRLVSAARLVTLKGATGAGKTRLAWKVAADLRGTFSDGICFVDLSALSDSAFVLQTVASALHVRQVSRRSPVDGLQRYLADKHILLILDGCEHMVSECARLAHLLLPRCPSLHILATSQQRLRVDVEEVFEVPPLSLPPRSHTPVPIDSLLSYDAFGYFVERAKSYRSGFELTQDNALAVEQICRRLEGNPTAIRLAAAQTRVLSAHEINVRLGDVFHLLMAGDRSAPPRHQTLRAAVDWSYRLLDEREQLLFNRLSVFPGTFTLEVVEAICTGRGLEAKEIFELVSQLVDKSMVFPDESPKGSTRYRLLESLRRYGQERQEEHGETEFMKQNHANFFLALAENTDELLAGPQQVAVLQRLEQEHDNLRAALAWLREIGQAEQGLRLGGALWRFWSLHGYVSEGREELRRLLELPGASARTAPRAEALVGRGLLAYCHGDLASSRSLVEEGLKIFRELGNKRGIAASLNDLGFISSDQGDLTTACRRLEEALNVSSELDDQQLTAHALHNLGDACLYLGDYERAGSAYQQSLAIKRKMGDEKGIANTLNSLGNLALYRRDYEEAGSRYRESLATKERLGDKRGVANSLSNLGEVAFHRGEYGDALSYAQQSLGIRLDIGDKLWTGVSIRNLGDVARAEGDHIRASSLYKEALKAFADVGAGQEIPGCLRGLAMIAVAQGSPEWAAVLFGADEAVRQALGIPLPPPDRADYERNVASVRAALDTASPANAWARGRTMTMERAIEFAFSYGGRIA